jgi:hypothetical protein
MRKLAPCALAVALFAASPARAGVGVSPPGKPVPFRMAATLGDTAVEITQDIIGPDKPGIIGPDRVFTAQTHVQACPPALPPGPCDQLKCPPALPPGPCRTVDLRVTAAEPLLARSVGLVAAVGELAGIIGPDIQARLAKAGIIGPEISRQPNGGSLAGIIGPERSADLISASLAATAPTGICVITEFGGPPCYAALPSMFRNVANLAGFGTTCGADQ